MQSNSQCNCLNVVAVAQYVSELWHCRVILLLLSKTTLVWKYGVCNTPPPLLPFNCLDGCCGCFLSLNKPHCLANPGLLPYVTDINLRPPGLLMHSGVCQTLLHRTHGFQYYVVHACVCFCIKQHLSDMATHMAAEVCVCV